MHEKMSINCISKPLKTIDTMYVYCRAPLKSVLLSGLPVEILHLQCTITINSIGVHTVTLKSGCNVVSRGQTAFLQKEKSGLATRD